MTTKCSKCGRFYSLRRTVREDDGRCFDCWFWNRRAEGHLAHPTKSIVVEGVAYFIGEEDRSVRAFRGFGGAKFHIRRFDGSEVISTNLWCQGTVAKNFRDVLADNAEFVRS